MNKLSVALLTLALVIGWGVTTACAAPYFSGNVGAVWLEDADFSESAGGDSVDAEFSFDTGFGVTAAIGNAHDNGMRAEVEFGYRSNEMDDLSGTAVIDGEVYSGSGSIDGDASATSLMLNVFYDFMPEASVTPFIGAGIGFANVEGDIDYVGEDDDNVFAYQAAAGIAFAVNPQTKFDIQYRYFATEDPEFGGVDFEYATHNAMLGMRVSF